MKTLLASLLMVTACGNLSDLSETKPMLKLSIFGVNESPDTAEGNSTPRFYELSLQGLNLRTTDGETISFAPEQTETYRVINRPQIIYEKDITEYAGTEFDRLTVLLDPEVTVGGKFASDHALTLSDSTISYEQSFSAKKSSDLEFGVKIQWMNTLTEGDSSETVAIPSFEVIDR